MMSARNFPETGNLGNLARIGTHGRGELTYNPTFQVVRRMALLLNLAGTSRLRRQRFLFLFVSGIIPVIRVGGSGWSGMRMRRPVAVTACIWGLLSACSVAAQTSENASPLTLHVYTNLVQIPTLVLGDDRKPIARIDERRFFVSLDGGRKLRRRMQGLRVMIPYR